MCVRVCVSALCSFSGYVYYALLQYVLRDVSVCAVQCFRVCMYCSMFQGAAVFQCVLCCFSVYCAVSVCTVQCFGVCMYCLMFQGAAVLQCVLCCFSVYCAVFQSVLCSVSESVSTVRCFRVLRRFSE